MNKKNWVGLILPAFFLMMSQEGHARNRALSAKLQPPTNGLYQGAFTDLPDRPIPVWGSRVNDFQNLQGKKLTWAYVLHDFVDGIAFPYQAVEEVAATGTTPFIRVLPRSVRVQKQGQDPVYKLQAFLNGDFDSYLREWCQAARNEGIPLLATFAPEANGTWYGWSGAFNGGAETTGYGDPNVADGPERYKDTFKRFVNICKAEGADNITWFLHLDSQPKSREPWNAMANYYPGDDVIDWMGLSAFGAQLPGDFYTSFTDVFEPAYNELAAVSQTKPLAVLEMGTIEDAFDTNRKASWINVALTALRLNRYSRVKAVSYWHESSWIASGMNNMRMDSSPQSLATYRMLIQMPVFLTDGVFN